MAEKVEILPAVPETWVGSLGQAGLGGSPGEGDGYTLEYSSL